MFFNLFKIKGINGGRCVSAPGTTNYQCVCPSGYTGRNCEIKDICNIKNPCICGTCSNEPATYDGFRCFCPVGYTGPRCERALNCLDTNHECKNGGQCVPRVLGDYVCSCPQPYCGLTCTNIVPQCNYLIKLISSI